MRRDKTSEAILIALGIPLVVWLALLLTPPLTGERSQLLLGLTQAMESPFTIMITEDSLTAVLLCLGAYAIGIGIYYSTRRNWRRREEHGSAKWGEVSQIVKRYRDRKFSNNKLFTAGFRLSLNVRKHKRNLNAIIIGGSGAGKTRGYCKPNVMQANSSMVILDPKGVRPDRM